MQNFKAQASNKSSDSKFTNSQRIPYFDFLRVFAAFFVILLHIAAAPFTNYGGIPDLTWHVTNVFDSASRWGVTVFFMISGALLLKGNPNESLRKFYLKKGPRILIPLLFWSIFYMFFQQFILNDSSFTLLQYFKAFINGSSIVYLWFIYALIGLYAATPFLRYIVAFAPKRVLWYFVLLSFIHVYLDFTTRQLFNLNIRFDFYIASEFLGVFVLGYLLSTTHLNKYLRILIYALGISGLVWTVYATATNTIETGKFYDIWYNNFSPNVLFMAISVFVFCKYSSFIHDLSNLALIRYMSTLTFGVYLIHPLYLLLIEELGTWSYNKSFTPFDLLIQYLIVSTLSFLTIFFLIRIPYIRRVIS